MHKYYEECEMKTNERNKKKLKKNLNVDKYEDENYRWEWKK